MGIRDANSSSPNKKRINNRNISEIHRQSIWKFILIFLIGLYFIAAILIFLTNLLVVPFVEYHTILGFIGYVIKGFFVGLIQGLGWPILLIFEWRGAINEVYFSAPLVVGTIISLFVADYKSSSNQ